MAWQPIETAPKDGTSVLVVQSSFENPSYSDGPHAVFQANFEDGIWMTLDCSALENRFWKVTHWQPLPKLPTLGASHA